MLIRFSFGTVLSLDSIVSMSANGMYTSVETKDSRTHSFYIELSKLSELIKAAQVNGIQFLDVSEKR